MRAHAVYAQVCVISWLENMRYAATTLSHRRMRLAPGIVVVDSTFLKDLKHPDSIAKIEAACRIAQLEIVPSVLNVLEALKHTDVRIRQELLDGIRRWTKSRPLNPWPLALLRFAGKAFPASEFSIRRTQMDTLIAHPEALQADHEKAVRLLEGLQAEFVHAFEAQRPEVQRTLKLTKQKYAWQDIGSFLESPDWTSRDNLSHLAGMLWKMAKLPGRPPDLEIVHRSEVWRIAMEAIGAATYVHAVKPDRIPNPPGFVDLMQLLYLSAHTRARILVTDDESFYQTATELLRGRYVNVRVLRGDEFLDRSA